VQVREQVVQTQKGEGGLQAEARCHTHHVRRLDYRYISVERNSMAGGRTTITSALETTELPFARELLTIQATLAEMRRRTVKKIDIYD
jgi:hypothetical protein